MSAAQRRVLEDFWDPDPETRHSRSGKEEWERERPGLLALGWLARGDGSQGLAYYVTEAGAAALAADRRGGQYNLKDLTGQTIAGCAVLRRAANVNGNARWLVRAACGCETVIEGIRLRAQAKAGRLWSCKEHRAKRPGTIRRREQ